MNDAVGHFSEWWTDYPKIPVSLLCWHLCGTRDYISFSLPRAHSRGHSLKLGSICDEPETTRIKTIHLPDTITVHPIRCVMLYIALMSFNNVSDQKLAVWSQKKDCGIEDQIHKSSVCWVSFIIGGVILDTL